MTNTKRLLVEGDADRMFFDALLRQAGFRTSDVWVGPPTAFGAGGRGKQNALRLIPDMIDEFLDGHLTHLGVVVDADHAGVQNQGFSATEQAISALMAPHGYALASKTSAGINYFRGSSPPISVWIMPNNRDDGLIEDWIAQSIHPTEQDLFKTASKAVGGISSPKFQSFHRSKADVATWLAWQKIPGQPIASVVGNQLIDSNSPLAKALMQWLTTTFTR